MTRGMLQGSFIFIFGLSVHGTQGDATIIEGIPTMKSLLLSDHVLRSSRGTVQSEDKEIRTPSFVIKMVVSGFESKSPA
jgi:hypothetical protein